VAFCDDARFNERAAANRARPTYVPRRQRGATRLLQKAVASRWRRALVVSQQRRFARVSTLQGVLACVQYALRAARQASVRRRAAVRSLELFLAGLRVACGLGVRSRPDACARREGAAQSRSIAHGFGACHCVYSAIGYVGCSPQSAILLPILERSCARADHSQSHPHVRCAQLTADEVCAAPSSAFVLDSLVTIASHDSSAYAPCVAPVLTGLALRSFNSALAAEDQPLQHLCVRLDTEGR
jgi:hypothetical protein